MNTNTAAMERAVRSLAWDYEEPEQIVFLWCIYNDAPEMTDEMVERARVIWEEARREVSGR